MPLHQYSVSPFIRQFMLHNAVHTVTSAPLGLTFDGDEGGGCWSSVVKVGVRVV